MGKLWTRNGVYYADYEDSKGIRRRPSLKTRDRKVAKERLRKLELATTDPATHGEQGLHEAMSYLLDVAMPTAGRSAATVSCYTQKGRHVLRLLPYGVLLRDITKDMLREYISRRLAEQAARGSIHKELVVIRQTLTEARERGLYSGDVGSVVPQFATKSKPKTRWLTVGECQAVLGQLPDHRRLWFALACFGGLRASEVELLRWEHVDIDRGWMRVRGEKTAGSDRNVVITDLLAPWLERDEQDVGIVAERWGNYRRDLQRACDRADVKRVSANDLRRTFASWLLQAGVDLLTVSRMLGHKSTRMVEQVYGQLSDQHFQDAAKKCAAFVTETCAQLAKNETIETQAGVPKSRKPREVSGPSRVPGLGIEPRTRGFSGLVPDEVGPRISRRKRPKLRVV